MSLQPHAVLGVVEVPEPLLAHDPNLHRVTDGDGHLRVVARSQKKMTPRMAVGMSVQVTSSAMLCVGMEPRGPPLPAL